MRIRHALRPWLLIAGLLLVATAAPLAQAGVAIGVSVAIAPPALPVYVQPPLPAPGYIWTPGFWAYGAYGYYWVPGTWVMAPAPGLLWTPGYWGWVSGAYAWHAGYWGPHVGFYGGVNYGFGYTGVGFVGGEWRGGDFYYNRAVANVSATNVTNVYNRTVVNNVTVNRVSYNGGTGGLSAKPNGAETAAANERHVEATGAQLEHQHIAESSPSMRASVNRGVPSIAATPRAGVYSGHGVVASVAAHSIPTHAYNAPAHNALPSSAYHPAPGYRPQGSYGAPPAYHGSYPHSGGTTQQGSPHEYGGRPEHH
jgi:WXXGXW repeat (2 copies)